MRIQGTSPEVLRKWFDAFEEEVVNDPDVLLENVYNMDESGFSIGTIKAGRVIIDSKAPNQFQAQPGRQEWVTVVECICADGTSIPPYVIFKGKDLNIKWIPDNIPQGWRITASTNGWTSNDHGQDWLRTLFEPKTHQKAGELKPRVLICDGHGSHVTGNFIEHCMNNNIKLLILPSHSSHFTQPLDISIFGPLKKYMSQELSHVVNAKVNTVQKTEWLRTYVGARPRAFSSQNINSSWSGAGLNPFQPRKVICRVHDDSNSESVTTPPPTSNPFDNALISSPVDILAFQAANGTLNQLIMNKQPLDTPARNYVRRLTQRSERLYAETVILQKEKTNLEGVVVARRNTESGKCRVLKGKHSIASEDILEQVRAEEAKIQAKKKKSARRDTMMVLDQINVITRDRDDIEEDFDSIETAD